MKKTICFTLLVVFLISLLPVFNASAQQPGKIVPPPPHVDCTNLLMVTLVIHQRPPKAYSTFYPPEGRFAFFCGSWWQVWKAKNHAYYCEAIEFIFTRPQHIVLDQCYPVKLH